MRRPALRGNLLSREHLHLQYEQWEMFVRLRTAIPSRSLPLAYHHHHPSSTSPVLVAGATCAINQGKSPYSRQIRSVQVLDSQAVSLSPFCATIQPPMPPGSIRRLHVHVHTCMRGWICATRVLKPHTRVNTHIFPQSLNFYTCRLPTGVFDRPQDTGLCSFVYLTLGGFACSPARAPLYPPPKVPVTHRSKGKAYADLIVAPLSPGSEGVLPSRGHRHETHRCATQPPTRGWREGERRVSMMRWPDPPGGRVISPWVREMGRHRGNRSRRNG